MTYNRLGFSPQVKVRDVTGSSFVSFLNGKVIKRVATLPLYLICQINMDGLVRDLHILSKVQIKNKLASDRSGLYIDNGGWTSSLLRWIRQDSRRQTVVDLSMLISRICEKKKDIGHLPDSIKGVIPQAIQGITNLICTYGDDPCLVSELEIINDKLKDVLEVKEPSKAGIQRDEIRGRGAHVDVAAMSGLHKQ